MNVEPLPEIKEEPDTKPEKGLNGFRWGQGRGLNRDEERYFSEDGPDEDDQPTPLISSPSLVSSKASGSTLLKRKRSTGNGRIAGGSSQMTLPRTLPIGNLVGYGGDDDDDEDEDGGDPFGGASHPPKRRLSASSGENANGPPATPRLSHRRIGSQAQPFQQLPSPDDEEDEEDTLLESLVTGPAIKLSSTPSSPSTAKPPSSPSPSSPELGPMRMGEKRRRGNDDDDEEWMLERLATKAKRISNVVGNGVENTEGGPKKIKLIINKLGSSLSTPSQMPTSGSDCC